MGISRGTVELIGVALRPLRRTGSVITFGVQKVDASLAEARQSLSRAGLEAAPIEHRQEGRIHQSVLFGMLGYGDVQSIDYFAAEGPTHIHDLNLPVPESLQQRFDLVYDGGTTEHCFSVPEVLSNAVRLARVGGHVIHHLPVNNWVDHGFYQLSPGLFFDFYEANGFDELRMWLHFIAEGKETFIGFDPRTDHALRYEVGARALGGSVRVLALFSARKVESRAAIMFPVQGRYRRAFGDLKGAAAARPSLFARLQRSLLRRTLRLRAKRLAT